ncbi:hypothetical protein MHTCC0001_22900 [Flavobacteriaceae bacterium MHTCC 0001]
MNKISKDLFFSVFFSVLNVIFNFWLIQQAEYLLAAVSLGVFMLMRRVVPTFANFGQLGTSQAIIRYVTLFNEYPEKVKTYFYISFVWWLICTSLFGIICLIFGEELGKLLYNTIEQGQQYFLYTVWYISILHLSYLVQPYFLTQRKIVRYNIINMLNASLIMIIVFKYFSFSVTINNLFTFSFFIMSILQLGLLTFIVIKLKIYRIPSITKVRSYGKEFYAYGIPRAVITFSDMLLLTIGALLVGKNGEEEIAAFLIALPLARIVLIVLQPISKLSSVIVGNNNSKEQQSAVVNLMTGTILYSTVLLLIILYNWLNVLIKFWLHNQVIINDVLYVFKILAIGIIPYSIFQGLKGVIEIKFYKPYNLYSLLISILLNITVFYVLLRYYDNLYSLSLSLTIAFVTLGLLTLYWCRKDFYNYKYYRFDVLIIIGIPLFWINKVVNIYYQNIYGCIICVMITTLIYILTIYLTKIRLIQDTLNIILRKKK